MLKNLILFSTFACLFCSCEPTSTTESKVKLGKISPTCGPADGPEFTIILSDSLLSCNSTKASGYFGHFLSQSYTLPKIDGKAEFISDRVRKCDSNYNCTELGKMTVTFQDSTNGIFKGNYKILDKDKVIESGAFQLKACSEMKDKCG